LKYFYLRRNCVILRNEYRKYKFTEIGDDNEHIHLWLEKHCRQYDRVEDAVSQLFQRRWKMLTDWEYNHIRV
jgi:G:T-mismatch repair DNA endonuclease (very short patch repair protein)